MPRTHRAVESFSPYLLEVYKQAALAPVRIRFATKEKATTYRADLNALRVSLGKEKHPLHALAVRCKNLLREEKNEDDRALSLDGPNLGPEITWLVITEPSGASYEEELEAAGIDPFGKEKEG